MNFASSLSQGVLYIAVGDPWEIELTQNGAAEPPATECCVGRGAIHCEDLGERGYRKVFLT